MLRYQILDGALKPQLPVTALGRQAAPVAPGQRLPEAADLPDLSGSEQTQIKVSEKIYPIYKDFCSKSYVM